MKCADWLPLLLIAAVCGCANTSNVDLLEARLRERDEQLRHVQTKLERLQAELEVARQESSALRAQLTAGNQQPLLPEQAGIIFRVEGIRFGSLLTGGQDEDGRPGDELLNVVLIPHDSDGELLKVPGRIELDVRDLTRPQDEQIIGTWTFEIDESREHWHRGFLAAGYVFRLPWQEQPASTELLLHARLTTPDDRQFDAARLIHVSLGDQRTASKQ